MPSPRDPVAVLAVDQSIDECRFVGIHCTPVGGAAAVSVAFVVEDEASMWAEVSERMQTDRRLLLAVGASLEVHVPGDLAERYVTFGQAELAKWTQLVRSLITSRRVTHDGSRQLAEQVNRAVAVRSYGGMPTLAANRSPGPIEMARCMVVAVALATKPPARKRVGSRDFVMGSAG